MAKVAIRVHFSLLGDWLIYRDVVLGLVEAFFTRSDELEPTAGPSDEPVSTQRKAVLA